MNIETVRDYCLTLPLATEDSAFGEDILLFRICEKIFACICLDRPDFFTVKCDPQKAIELRERHPEIEGAWHWNKKYWNQINLTGSLTDEMMEEMIRHSYAEVVKKLPRKTRIENPEINLI